MKEHESTGSRYSEQSPMANYCTRTGVWCALVWSISGTTVLDVLVAFAASDADELLDAASVS